MKKWLLSSVSSSALVLATVSPVAAADLDLPPAWHPQWYVSVFGGAVFHEDHDYGLVDPASSNFGYSQNFDTGFIVGGAVGVEVGLGFRGEVELAFQNNQADTVSSVGAGTLSDSGEVEAFTVLANLWYDFDLGMPITPYVGGGIGIGFVDGNATDSTGFTSFNDDDEVFAFQVGAGISYSLTDVIDLSVGYRFRGLLDYNPGSAAAGFTYDDDDLYSHVVVGGITFKLDGL